MRSQVHCPAIGNRRVFEYDASQLGKVLEDFHAAVIDARAAKLESLEVGQLGQRAEPFVGDQRTAAEVEYLQVF